MLKALDSANTASSTTVERLRRALPFVELANTDDDLMTPMAEVILMALAFEQMLDVEYKRELVLEFEKLFVLYGSVTVQDALQKRPGIQIDQD